MTKDKNFSRLIEQEISADSLQMYVSQKFPELDYEYFPGNQQRMLLQLQNTRFQTIKNIDDAFNKTEKILKKFIQECSSNNQYPGALSCIEVSLAIVDKEFRIKNTLGPIGRSFVEKNAME